MGNQGKRWKGLIYGIALSFIPALAGAGEVPANDLCTNPTGPLDIPSTVSGQTTTATLDLAPLCGLGSTANNVWFTVVGTGNTITVETCDGNTDFDTQLTVFCDSCENLTCVGVNDDNCGLASRVSWCTEEGVTYRIQVHGFNGATGNFRLHTSQSTTPCTDPPPCGVAVPVPVTSPLGLVLLGVLLLMGGAVVLAGRGSRVDG